MNNKKERMVRFAKKGGLIKTAARGTRVNKTGRSAWNRGGEGPNRKRAAVHESFSCKQKKGETLREKG